MEDDTNHLHHDVCITCGLQTRCIHYTCYNTHCSLEELHCVHMHSSGLHNDSRLEFFPALPDNTLTQLHSTNTQLCPSCISFVDS